MIGGIELIFFGGFSRNLLFVMYNIPTVVSITHKVNGDEFVIYVRFIVINLQSLQILSTTLMLRVRFNFGLQ